MPRESLAAALVILAGCGPSVVEAGSESDDGTTSQDPATTSAPGTTQGPTTTAPADTTSTGASTGEDSTGGPELPLPPGIDHWGFTLAWTGIVGHRFGIGDIDGDGHVDVTAHWRLDDGDLWSMTTHLGSGDGMLDAQVPTQIEWDGDFYLGDFDGDGDLEQIAYLSQIGYRVLSHQGDGRFDQLVPATLIGGLGDGIDAVLDVDGDGRDDLFEGGLHSSLGTILLNRLEAEGYVFEGTPELPYPACFFVRAQPVDRDGDGDEDLFATGSCNSGSPDYTWYGYYENDGTMLALAQVFPGDPAPYEGTHPRRVDFDDDGLEDLAIGGAVWTNQDGILSTGLVVFTNHAGPGYQLEYFEHEWAQWGPEVFGLRLPVDERGAVVADQGEHDSVLLMRSPTGDGLEAHGVWLGGKVLDVADFDEDGRPDLAVTRTLDEGRELGLWLSGG